MSRNCSVNRCLKAKSFDYMDHALGRPVFPLRESYRNFFATDAKGAEAGAFSRSPFWALTGLSSDMAYFHVTDAGRGALAEHLTSIGDWRPFEVVFEGRRSTVAAKSAAKAKYLRFLDIADCFADLTFGEFARKSSARRAAA